jgi:hypothetical protein
VPWSNYQTSLDTLRYFFVITFALLFIITIWRLIVITRWRANRRAEKRASATFGYGGGATAGNGAAVGSTFALLHYHHERRICYGGIKRFCRQTDSQWWLFVFVRYFHYHHACTLKCISSYDDFFCCANSIACVLVALDSLDPVLSEGIWSENFLSNVLRVFNTPISLDAMACWVRFYLLIHARWYSPTRRIIIWFDRFIVLINVASLIGFCFVIVANSSWSLIFYVGVLVVASIFFMCGSALYAQTTLKSLVRRLAPTPAQRALAAASAAQQKGRGISVAVTFSSPSPPPLLPVTSSLQPPNAIRMTSTGAPPNLFIHTLPTSPKASSSVAAAAGGPASPTSPSSTNSFALAAQAQAVMNLNAFNAARQMLHVIRWCQLLALFEIGLILYHNLTNPYLNDPIEAMVYFWLLRGGSAAAICGCLVRTFCSPPYFFHLSSHDCRCFDFLLLSNNSGR